METIIFNNSEYILCDVIFKNMPEYVKKFRTTRDFIKKNNIEPQHYEYVQKINGEWIKTNGKSKKYDKILLSKSFFKKMHNFEEKYELAPELLNLTFNENQDFLKDIEIRGIIEKNLFFFKYENILNYFNLKDIFNAKSYYIENEDYKYFNCGNLKTLFLTYEGVLRVLFTTRNNKTTPFIKWAVETLFTVQMGSTENKNSLISKMKGVSYNTIQELFNINAREIPCVYLTVFNDVKTLRNKMNISNEYNDDDFVYKFGLTNSFEKRKNGHKSEYKDIENLIEFKLVYFAYIDPLFLNNAETEIKNIFKDNIIEYKKHTEIVILSKKELNYIKNAFELIARKYSGHNEELLKEIEQLKNEKITIELKCSQQIELIQKQMYYEKQELITKTKYEMENELLKKENECKLLIAEKELEIYKNLYKQKLNN